MNVIAKAFAVLALMMGSLPTPVQAQTQPQSRAQASVIPNDWDERTVFSFLAAELLAQDENYEQAALTLWPIARQLKQVELFERVVQWAAKAKRFDILYSAATGWQSSDVNAVQPQHILAYLLITQRLERMAQLRLTGKPKEAREQLLAAFDAREKIRTVDIAILLAEQLEDDYHYEKALEIYQLAAKLDPKQWVSIAKIQFISAKLNHPKAVQELSLLHVNATANVAMTSLDKQAIAAMLIALLRENQQFEAAKQIIQTLPPDEQMYELALTYDAMGQTAQAHALLRQSLTKSPQASHLLNMLGYSLVDHNAHPAALAEGTVLLEAANQAAPNNSAILDSLGWAYFRNKQYAKALPLLQKSYDLKRDPEVAAHLGELLFVTGKNDLAHQVWSQGLALEPKHRVLNATIKRLGVTLTLPALHVPSIPLIAPVRP